MSLLVYGVSIRGNGHYASGQECQDRNSFEESDFSKDKVKVAAMADGHGGAPYFRSAEGAALAVKKAKEILHDFVEKNKGDLDKISKLETEIQRTEAVKNSISDFQDVPSIGLLVYSSINGKSDSQEKISALKTKIQNDLKELPDIIVKEWKKEIDSKIKENPVKVAEIEITSPVGCEKFTGYAEESDGFLKMITVNLSQSHIERVRRKKYEIYGSTLIAAARYNDHNFVIQIGDGKVVFLEKDGEISFPIPEQENQIGNATNSICQDDAAERFVTDYSYKPLNMIMETSDGVSNAVDSDGKLGEVADLIYNSFYEDPDTFRKEIKPFLRQFSEASSDDCTLCMIADVDEKAFESLKKQSECEEDSSELELLYKPPFAFLGDNLEKAFIKYRIETLFNGTDEENIEYKYGKITKIDKNEIFFENMSTDEYSDSLKDCGFDV